MKTPQDIIEEYKQAETQLKEFFRLSGIESHCSKCGKCCNAKKYRFNLIADGKINSEFRKEQLRYIPDENSDQCPCISKEGCILDTCREPICIAHLCETEINYLKKNFGISYCSTQISSRLMAILKPESEPREIKLAETRRLVESWMEVTRTKTLKSQFYLDS